VDGENYMRGSKCMIFT